MTVYDDQRHLLTDAWLRGVSDARDDQLDYLIEDAIKALDCEVPELLHAWIRGYIAYISELLSEHDSTTSRPPSQRVPGHRPPLRAVRDRSDG